MDVPPEIEVLPGTIAAIVARYGLGTSTAARLFHAGTSNSIYLLGDAFVLRVPHNHPTRIGAVATEVTAVTAAHAAGVSTPQLVVFDQSGEFLPVPYAIYERVHGITLASLGPDPPSLSHTWRELGRDLARLHSQVSVDGPAGRLPPIGSDLDPRLWLDDLTTTGMVLPDEAHWLRRWLDRLAPFMGDSARHDFVMETSIPVM